MHRTIRILLLLAALPALAWSQSLGEVAKKERERREKNKDKGVTSRQFSEKEIFGEEEGETTAETTEGHDADAPQAATESSTPRTSDLLPGVLETPETPESNDGDDERAERLRSEVEWRGRLQRAQQTVASARQRLQFLKELHLIPGEYYVDAQGNTVIRSLDELRSLVTEAEAELAAAEQDVKDLREEARRAGVPPGWLR